MLHGITGARGRSREWAPRTLTRLVMSNRLGWLGPGLLARTQLGGVAGVAHYAGEARGEGAGGPGWRAPPGAWRGGCRGTAGRSPSSG